MNVRGKFTSVVIAFLCCLAFLFGACDLEKKNGIVDTFPHVIHIEQEISCDVCHELNPELENGITLPLFGVCTNCHVPDDEVFSRCNTCHEENNIELTDESLDSHKALYEPFLPEKWKDVKYNHAEFLEDSSDCLSCHQNIATAKFSSLDNLPTMKVSMDVHERMGLSNECEHCHIELTTFTPPASHNSRWPETHGRLMEFQDKDSCLMCHQEATCTTCHDTQKPRNHTNLWRRKTHGIQASFDRAKCMVCHRNDECIVCHQATADPVPAAPYHTPDASCLTCHSPLAAQGPSPRPPQRLFKPMPHRMMMGVTAQKCMECHLF